jgi:hypothetical protein
MRATEKYVKGLALAEKKNLPIPYPRDNENLYAMLEKKAFGGTARKRLGRKNQASQAPQFLLTKRAMLAVSCACASCVILTKRSG